MERRKKTILKGKMNFDEEVILLAKSDECCLINGANTSETV